VPESPESAVAVRQGIRSAQSLACLLQCKGNTSEFANKELLNKYNNPSFATMFQRALLNTNITTCFGLNPSHHQVRTFSILYILSLDDGLDLSRNML
jgi:hypothetical protein